MTAFPHSGKSMFASSPDPNMMQVQKAIQELQELLLGLGNTDPSLRLIAGFEDSLQSLLGPDGEAKGPLRFQPGRSGSGLLVEGAGSNLITNPSAELDTVGWQTPDSSVLLSRDGQVHMDKDIVSQASFRLEGTNDAGSTMIKTPVAVSPNRKYSASAYLFAGDNSASKARLDLAFTGGTPVFGSSGDLSLTPNGWTRIRVENVDAGNNTTCEVMVALAQQAPGFNPGSQLSTLSPTDTAQVQDTAMTIQAGDICLCTVSANPEHRRYGWHMVTSGSTGVAGSSLRLDDSPSAPTFVSKTQFSRLAPSSGDSVPVSDTSLVLNVGDLVFCNIEESGYGWHVVTTTAAGASSTGLRLDDAPSAPRYASNSRLTRIVPLGTAPVSDTSMTLSVGDVVFARTINNPSSQGYAWHVVTYGATGVNSPALRLDGYPAAPVFATSSLLSTMHSAATGTNADTTAVLNVGDLAFASPTRNPASNGYGWHMVTTAATGVSSSSLRLDQASSEVINVDCVQLEMASTASSYIDSFQGATYFGAVGSVSNRVASSLSYDGKVISPLGTTVAFWMSPMWEASDGQEHVLFDLAAADKQDRIRLAKDRSNNLVLSVYDGNGGLRQLVSSGPVGYITRESQHHVAFTVGAGNLRMFLDGASLSATASGSGTAQLSKVGPKFYLGSDYRGVVTDGTVFDELVIWDGVMTDQAIRLLAMSPDRFLGVSLVRQAQGSDITSATPGVQSSVSHGLGYTPQFVVITERNDGRVYLSAPSDSTHFYVMASAASVNFDWRASA